MAGWALEGGAGGGADVGVDVRGIFGGEEDDAGWIQDEGSFEHEVGEGFGVAEVGVGGGGPALAEGFVFDDRFVDGVEVFCEGAVVDSEGLGGGVWDLRVEKGPFVLQGTAVGGVLGEEGWDFAGAAADAEGADGSLFYFGFEQLQESVVLEVPGGGLVEEPEVDVIGAEGEEAAVEGGFGVDGGEGGAFGIAGGGFGRVGEALLEAGELFFDGAMPYFVVTVTWPRWCWRNSPRQASASP